MRNIVRWTVKMAGLDNRYIPRGNIGFMSRIEDTYARYHDGIIKRYWNGPTWPNVPVFIRLIGFE